MSHGDAPPGFERTPVRDWRGVVEEAVFALLPIVPVNGSHQRGYQVSERIDPTLRATPEEWANAAHAVCNLHALVRERP